MSLSRIGLYISFILFLTAIGVQAVYGDNLIHPEDSNRAGEYAHADLRIENETQKHGSVEHGVFSRSSYFDLTSYSFASLEKDRIKDFLETRNEEAKPPVSKAVQTKAIESLSEANTQLVPEPASIHLIALGVVFWACRRRRGI